VNIFPAELTSNRRKQCCIYREYLHALFPMVGSIASDGWKRCF